jgi:antiviral helicase SKI2
MVKVGGPTWYLNIKKGLNFVPITLAEANSKHTEAIKFADKELSKLCASWTSTVWDEMDWARIKELQVRDILEKRQAQAAITQSCRCLQCPSFLKHVSCHLFLVNYTVTDFGQFEMQHDEWQVKENISQLKQLMSDQNLQLLPDYEQRIQVLRDLGFIDEQSRVQLKGKVACEVSHPIFRGAGIVELIFMDRFTRLMNWY